MFRVIRFALASILIIACHGDARSTSHGDPAANINSGLATTATTSHDRTTTRSALSSMSTNGTCLSRTVNYITHTLPQQCLRTDRTALDAIPRAASSTHSDETPDIVETHLDSVSPQKSHAVTTDAATAVNITGVQVDVATTSSSRGVGDVASTAISSVETVVFLDSEIESESALDNANFLSFEEWKKQNLAKAGQSLENIGHERARHTEGERQRLGLNSALDSLGEDSEIDLDFGGFGGVRPSRRPSEGQPLASSDTSKPDTSSPGAITVRSKDAGKTCKERTNYASFDCAATVLKNNNECKSASSVLVEHKDSYMLNICSAKNKYFIVELCNDILIDTIVLANYEFFSSSFRHFRVSVSDRFPVRSEKWRDLGTFEAHNTREVQAFLIEEPLIWARYLRIEILSHYGNEYYCPVSLLRVHGTTMMQEFRNQEELARGEVTDDDVVVQTEVLLGEPILQERDHLTDEAIKSTLYSIPAIHATESDVMSTHTPGLHTGPSTKAVAHELVRIESSSTSTDSVLHKANETSVPSPAVSSTERVFSKTEASDHKDIESEIQTSASEDNDTAANSIELVVSTIAEVISTDSSLARTSERSQGATGTNSSSSDDVVKLTSTLAVNAMSVATQALNNSIDTSSAAKSVSSIASSSPPLPQPSTQESFFKSIHKRLQQLESNSTLSSQYIEEQSRMLRDAFGKVEKRQLTTTTTFLSTLNSTVMTELHGFRQAYDQLWQSTVIELEIQREQNQREMLALSSRLTLVADELVWQKRMGILQSTLLLLCLGVVLFVRQGNSYLELPLVQQMANKAVFRTSVGWDSDPNSPSPDSTTPASSSPVRFLRRMPRGIGLHTSPDHQPQMQHSRSDNDDDDIDIDIQPPTPDVGIDCTIADGDDSNESDEHESYVSETQSAPTTPGMAQGTEEGSPRWPDEIHTSNRKLQPAGYESPP